MRSKLVHEAHGERTFIAVLDTGDEVMASLQHLAETEALSAARVSAIGALEQATLAFFDWETKDYLKIPVEEQVELLSMNGDIALGESGKPSLHLHAVLGRRDGGTMGGHLVQARVRPTLEVLITETPAHLRRRKDETTGLALIQLGDW
jgi:uncharacterized protein